MLTQHSLLSGFLFSSVLAFEANSGDLLLSVDGLNRIEGMVYLTLCDTPSCFDSEDDDAPFYAMVARRVERNNALFTLNGLPKGEYAALVFHDINANHEFDVSFLGRAKEAYGYSNSLSADGNVQFENAKFSIPENGSVSKHIHLSQP